MRNEPNHAMELTGSAGSSLFSLDESGLSDSKSEDWGGGV
jgi:hypothetical protein